MKRVSKIFTACAFLLLYVPLLVMIVFSFNSGKSTANFQGFDLRWYIELLSGGAMLDLHIHDVDMLIALLGMPTAVSAMARNLIPGSGYDAMSVNYRFGDGAFANATCDWTIPHDKFNTRTIRVNLDGGYLFLDRTAKRTTFVAVATDGTVEDLSEQIASFDAYYNEIVYFMNCVKNGTQPTVCLPEASMLSVKLVEAEMRSADLGGELIKL